MSKYEATRGKGAGISCTVLGAAGLKVLPEVILLELLLDESPFAQYSFLSAPQ